MRALFTLAGRAIREALRSPMIWGMLILLGTCLIGILLTLEGDGTPEGIYRIMIRYTLGTVRIILSITALWAGCSAISFEQERKTLHLIVTRPVRPLQLWLGKWLGITLIHGVWILIAGLLVFALTQTHLFTASSVPHPHATQRPLHPDPATADTPSPPRIVAPGDTCTWTFTDSAPLSSGHPIRLRFRFISSELGPGSIAGKWTVTGTGFNTPAIQHQTSSPRRPDQLSFSPDQSAPHTDLQVAYTHQGDSSIRILFPSDDGLTLFIHHGAWIPNLLRALTMIFLQISIFAAIGVTAGTLFSFPVALLTSLYVLLVIRLGGALYREPAGDTSADALLHRIGPFVYASMDRLTAPLRKIDPLPLLAADHLIPPHEVLRLLNWSLFIYIPLLALLGIWVFQRQEPAIR